MPKLLRIVKITNVILLFFLLLFSSAALTKALSFTYNDDGRYFDDVAVYEEQAIEFFGFSSFILIVVFIIAIRWLMKKS